MKGSYVYATRNGQPGRFTEYVWNAMGPDKNGWILDPAKNGNPVEKPSTKIVKGDLDSAAKYTQLIDQAKGFEKDKQWAQALRKYSEASVLKQTEPLTKKIKQVEKELADEMEATFKPVVDDVTEALNAADEAFHAGDYAGAKNLYLAIENPGNNAQYIHDRLGDCEDSLLA